MCHNLMLLKMIYLFQSEARYGFLNLVTNLNTIKIWHSSIVYIMLPVITFATCVTGVLLFPSICTEFQANF